MNSTRSRMLSEGFKCPFCSYKMKKTLRHQLSEAGLEQFVCPICWFTAFFVLDDGNSELKYHGVRMITKN